MTDATQWISVGDLAHAFAPDSYSLPISADLAGTSLDLHFADGRIIRHQFETAERLTWAVTAGPDAGRTAAEDYFAAKVRDGAAGVRAGTPPSLEAATEVAARAGSPHTGIYFVDFVKHEQTATCVSLVLDLDRHIFTAVVGVLPGEDEARKDLLSRVGTGLDLTGVAATFHHGCIDGPCSADGPRHTISDELVDKRVEYTYSPTEQYEHIYLNENFYAWQCLAGAEKGLADVDRCHYIRLADALYLFVWREKIVPTLGVVVTDLREMRSNGKIFGYAGGDFATLANFRVGSKARLLNVTQRD